MIDSMAVAQVVIAVSVIFVWVFRYDNIQREFREYGLPDLVRNAVGATKIAGATLLLAGLWYPSLVFAPAVVMAVLMFGAQIAHARAAHVAQVRGVPAAPGAFGVRGARREGSGALDDVVLRVGRGVRLCVCHLWMELSVHTSNAPRVRAVWSCTLPDHDRRARGVGGRWAAWWLRLASGVAPRIRRVVSLDDLWGSSEVADRGWSPANPARRRAHACEWLHLRCVVAIAHTLTLPIR